MKIEEKEIVTLDAHFRQWQEIATRIRAQVTPALKVQEALQKSLEPIIEAQRTFRNALDPILAELNSWWEFKAPKFEELQKSFRELPPRTQEALLLLGGHGWYFDLNMSLPDLWQLRKALSEGNVGEAEEALAIYFADRLEEIEQTIVKRFPHRAHLIRAAINAHRRQEYELSIPVLLAQTDGICKEVVNQYLFRKQDKRPQTAIYVEQVAVDTYRAALLSPLAQTLPINASAYERPENTNVLNRHMVLHGESVDYGSKINSLKTISLINYVAQVLDGWPAALAAG